MLRLRFLALALLPLSLAACQSQYLQHSGAPSVQQTHSYSTQQNLARYTWQLNTGVAQPMELSFHDNGRLSVKTTCNSLGASWQLDGNNLVVGQTMMTQMACYGDAMHQESLAIQLLDQAKITFVADFTHLQQPTLTLTDKQGQRHSFKGKMTPEARYNTQAETIFLEISPETKSCTGVAPQTCLQVREVKYSQSGLKTHVDQNWTLFYDQIEGYQHQPNERQIVRVKRFEIKNPAADQSKYAYVYDMAVEREAIRGSL